MEDTDESAFRKSLWGCMCRSGCFFVKIKAAKNKKMKIRIEK